MDELIAFYSARLDEAQPAEVCGCLDANHWPPCTDQSSWRDPILRDIAADRGLLAKYALAKGLLPGKYKLGYCEALEEVIRLRAWRFSDHPDYQAAEWKPGFPLT